MLINESLQNASNVSLTNVVTTIISTSTSDLVEEEWQNSEPGNFTSPILSLIAFIRKKVRLGL